MILKDLMPIVDAYVEKGYGDKEVYFMAENDEREFIIHSVEEQRYPVDEYSEGCLFFFEFDQEKEDEPPLESLRQMTLNEVQKAMRKYRGPKYDEKEVLFSATDTWSIFTIDGLDIRNDELFFFEFRDVTIYYGDGRVENLGLRDRATTRPKFW